jgi:transcriptional regulator with XRE-family HTH domain
MKNFNNLPQWLSSKLRQKGIRPEKFAWKVKISRAQVYYYLSGHTKPSTQVMARICRVLNVSLEEGLQQFSPSVIGRPKGTSGRTREVTVRTR